MHMFKHLPLLAGLLILLFAGCAKEEPVQITTAIELSPSTVHLNDSEEGTLLLSPKPNGIGDWMVSSTPSWLTVSPEEGSLNAETELKLIPNTHGLQAGTYTGEVEITSTAGFATAEVTLTIAAKPKAQLNSTALSFPAETDQQKFRIENTGTGGLNWQLETAQPWISFEPGSGTLAAGQSTEVLVSVSRTEQPVGRQQGELTLISNSIDGNMLLPVDMEVPEIALIGVSAENLSFDFFIDEQEITITNEGNVTYNWSAIEENSLVNMVPANGSLEIGESAVITLTPNRGELSTGEHNSPIILSNNKGESVEVPVLVKHFNEEKWLIEGLVKDAEYDRHNDKLIVVADAELRKYDFMTKTVTSVTLNLPGACVSVSPDGNYAMVGHNAILSYVNLSTMTLEKTIEVSTDVYDVVLAANGYAYAFPRTGQWENIRAINISTGKETLSTGSSIYHGTKAKLHPSGSSIYGANNGLSPSDIEKYDISKGNAAFLYDSPYHGDFSMNGDLWFSEDGSRIFTRGGNVFKATTDRATDMYYAGALEGVKRVLALDHSAAAGKVYAVLNDGSNYSLTPSSTVGIFDGTYYTLQSTFELPKFIQPDGAGGGTIHEAQGHFGFFNSAGTAYYAVTRNKDDEQSFALVAVEVQ
jgi:hypothetical protein